MKIPSEREKEILANSLRIIKEELNPERIFLFGSRAKGTSSTNSDFDFAVDMKEPDFNSKNKLEEKLEGISGLYKIDLVFLDSIEEEFKNIIINSGEIVYER